MRHSTHGTSTRASTEVLNTQIITVRQFTYRLPTTYLKRDFHSSFPCNLSRPRLWLYLDLGIEKQSYKINV